jgi:hypothetical protein
VGDRRRLCPYRARDGWTLSRLEALLAAQRALRSRFDDFQRALHRDDRPAIEVALVDFERHLRRWTEIEEKSLVPAVMRADIPGRDAQRELHLEYIQIRELTRYLVQQIAEGILPGNLVGFADNLDRRLHAHEKEMGQVYYPAAASNLTDAEWRELEQARPEE